MTSRLRSLPIRAITIKEGRRPLRSVNGLAESIKSVGLLSPITVRPVGKSGKKFELVAGHHRLEACRSLGMRTIRAFVSTLSNLKSELVEIDENLVREELTTLERALALVRRKEIYEGLHPETRSVRVRGGPGTGKAGRLKTATKDNMAVVVSFVDDAAHRQGISSRTISRLVAIGQALDPKVAAAIQKLPIEYNQRELARLAKHPPAIQARISKKLLEGDESVTAALRTIRLEDAQKSRRRIRNEACTLIRGDFRKVGSRIDDVSAQLIIADPPYGRGCIELYGPLVALAARVLKPGGHLLTIPGNLHLPDFLESAAGGKLNYEWTLAHVGGQSRVMVRQVLSGWKPIVWHSKPRETTRELQHELKWNPKARDIWVQDVLRGTASERKYHKWQQAEAIMAQLIDQLTQPGDLVVAPFLGSGTVGVVALSLGRRFIGIEIEKGTLAVAQTRIAEQLGSKGD